MTEGNLAVRVNEANRVSLTVILFLFVNLFFIGHDVGSDIVNTPWRKRAISSLPWELPRSQSQYGMPRVLT